MRRRPQVTLSFAQSLDGRIATRDGVSQWISGEQTLNLAHQLRERSDAILVGVGTVIADDPRLTCRLPGGSSPLRVVLDGALRTPAKSNVAATAREIPTLIYCADACAEAAEPLRANGAEVAQIALAGDHLDLTAVLTDLYSRGVESLLVEGGSAVITSFVAQALWDEIVAVMAPMIIGTGTDSVGDLGVTELADAVRGHTKRVTQMGEDVVWEVVREP